MTNEEAIKMLTAKVECTKCLLDGTNPVCGYENCDDCDLCYAQGTAGDQIEALEKVIKALSRSEIPNSCHDGDKDINVPNTDKYEYHYDHTDCIWYRPEARNRCPSTCAQYRDGWNDAMNYIFRDGKGYRPYRRGEQYGE